jgi:hypothetical protein
MPTRDRHVAIGELVGPYHYVDNVEPRARHRRPVAWVNTGVARDAFGRDLLVTLNGHHTVQEFTAPEAASRLKALADTDIDPGHLNLEAQGGHRPDRSRTTDPRTHRTTRQNTRQRPESAHEPAICAAL